MSTLATLRLARPARRAAVGLLAVGLSALVGLIPLVRTGQPNTEVGQFTGRPLQRPAVLSGAQVTDPGPRCDRPWIAPVQAPVTDPFRPPDHRYGPGNRGIEYGTDPGQDVVAVADGIVSFAGPVAGHPVVVIDHGAGLRSSYVNLVARSAGRGERAVRGQPIATADAAFHLGARRDGSYIDPAELLDRRCLIVRLVPAPVAAAGDS